jgi:hypothetical protein
MDIREFAKYSGSYFSINREERNLAAIFYSLLLHGDNLNRFLETIESKFSADPESSEVYYEYAYLRDLWNARIRGNNELARKIVLDFLDPPDQARLAEISIRDFNEHFGAAPKASEDFIQSPSNWSIGRFRHTIEDPVFFLQVCKFKWSFNAKPDIVIHPNPDQAVCVEAKFESEVGVYPQKRREKNEFVDRGLQPVSQTECQKYLFEKLLGFDTEYILLAQNPDARSKTHKLVTWKKTFSQMDLSPAPRFVREWIAML